MSSYWLAPLPTSAGSTGIKIGAFSAMEHEAIVNLVSTPLT
jgi:hypothetical protein